MKIIILGSTGKIGSAIAFDLTKIESVKKIGLAGTNEESLERLSEKLDGAKHVIHAINIEDGTKLTEVLREYDAGIISLPNRRLSYMAIESAISAQLDVVDILEEYHRRPEPFETEGMVIPENLSLEEYGEDLHNRARNAGVTILDGMGFAPGLSNITTQAGIEFLDKPISAIARVGGIPSKETSERHPLKYLITWSFEHVLREYMVNLSIRKNGEVVQVKALDEPEEFEFKEFGINEKLECFITPGMPSFIFTHPELDYFTEKTIRWPGHRAGILTLKECGLLDMEQVDFQGQKVSPREFMLSQLQPRLKPIEGDSDVCVMFNTIKGMKDGKDCTVQYYMWDEEDTVNKITSMSRVTGYSASIAGVMLAEGKILTKGIVAPEEVITAELFHEFMDELVKRNIYVERKVT